MNRPSAPFHPGLDHFDNSGCHRQENTHYRCATRSIHEPPSVMLFGSEPIDQVRTVYVRIRSTSHGKVKLNVFDYHLDASICQPSTSYQTHLRPVFPEWFVSCFYPGS